MIAVVILTSLALMFGLILGYVAIRFKVEGDPIVEQIDAVLPQTQCGQCGFAGCRPYAEAIAAGASAVRAWHQATVAHIVAFAEEDDPGIAARAADLPGRDGHAWIPLG